MVITYYCVLAATMGRARLLNQLRKKLSGTTTADTAMFSLYSNMMKFGSSGGHDRAQRVDRKQRRISNYRQNDPNPRTPLSAAILNASRPRRRGLFIPKYTSSIIWPDFNLVEEISLPLNIECGVRARVRACVRGERRG